ncbi:MAG: hypothetical protein H7257_07275 [Taibaiella sp.]|nr:hypothetical protein [Taibaiella sp.]
MEISAYLWVKNSVYLLAIMENMYNDIWSQFLSALKSSVESENLDVLSSAWESVTNRTSYYKENLFPKISSCLGLEYTNKEFLTIDAAFYKRGSGNYPVPIVLIESENNASTTENEVYKLCFFNAPLKVLFICCDWDENIKLQFTKDYWDFILNDFTEVNKLAGVFAVIIAQWDENGLRFNSFAYGENGLPLNLQDEVFCLYK